MVVKQSTKKWLTPGLQKVLFAASDILINAFFDDYHTVFWERSETLFSTRLGGYLPQSYFSKYTPLFYKEFGACVISVAWKLAQPRPLLPASVAEQLAAWALFQEAKALLSRGNQEKSSGEAEQMWQAFSHTYFPDTSFLRLFDPAFEGIAANPTIPVNPQSALIFENWFHPFSGQTQYVHPYAGGSEQVGQAYQHELTQREREILATAIAVLIDEIFDAIILRNKDESEEFALFSLDWHLPSHYRPDYTPPFQKQFIVCIFTVALKLVLPKPTVLSSIIEELAAWAIITTAKQQVELDNEMGDEAWELDEDKDEELTPEDAFENFLEVYLEDEDFLQLFDAESEGIETSPVGQWLSMTSLAFKDWCKPFTDEPTRIAHPYIWRAMKKKSMPDTETRQSRRTISELRVAVETAKEQGPAIQVEYLLIQLGRTYQENGHPKLAAGVWREAALMAKARGAYYEAAVVFDLLRQALLAMNATRKALDAHQRSFCLFNEIDDFLQKVEQSSRIAYLRGTLGEMQRSEELFRQARRDYRELRNSFGEAVSFSRQAEIFWERAYHPADAHGLLMHAICLFEELFWRDEIDQDALALEKQRALQLQNRMRLERGEDGWTRFLRMSDMAYRRVRSESDEDKEQERQRLNDRTDEIAELGFLRHDSGRLEPEALPALAAIGEHGLNQAACRNYEALRTRLRRHHNRLAEAIIAGTVLLIEQVAQNTFEWTDDERVLLLYRDSGDQVGVARTLFNRGIGASLAHPDRLIDAFSCVSCAADAFSLLGRADERERGHRILASWAEQMNADAVERARTFGKELYDQFFTKSPRHIGLYRGRGTREPRTLAELTEPSRQRYAEAPHLLAATGRIFSELVDEALSAHPSQREWSAYDECTMLRGITTGISLAGDPQTLERKFRIQFMDMGVWDAYPDDIHPDFFTPIAHRTRDGFDSGIQLVGFEKASRLVADYLDREYSRQFEGRAVEFLDSRGHCALQIGWLYNILGTSWHK